VSPASLQPHDEKLRLVLHRFHVSAASSLATVCIGLIVAWFGYSSVGAALNYAALVAALILILWTIFKSGFNL